MTQEWSWAPVDWIAPMAEPAALRWEDIQTPVPMIRGGGGVLGHARHRAALYMPTPRWPEPIVVPSIDPGRLSVLSAWILDYATGDFAALHTDRPDSAFTALVALDDEQQPLVVCAALVGLSDEAILRRALREPFPPGHEVTLQRDRCLTRISAQVI